MKAWCAAVAMMLPLTAHADDEDDARAQRATEARQRALTEAEKAVNEARCVVERIKATRQAPQPTDPDEQE